MPQHCHHPAEHRQPGTPQPPATTELAVALTLALLVAHLDDITHAVDVFLAVLALLRGVDRRE